MIKDKTFFLSTQALKRLATEGRLTFADDETVIKVTRANMDGTVGALASGHEIAIKGTDYSIKY